MLGYCNMLIRFCDGLTWLKILELDQCERHQALYNSTVFCSCMSSHKYWKPKHAWGNITVTGIFLLEGTKSYKVIWSHIVKRRQECSMVCLSNILWNLYYPRRQYSSISHSSSLEFSNLCMEFVYSLNAGKPHSLGLKSNNELRTWSAPLWYETSSLGSGTITADLHK